MPRTWAPPVENRERYGRIDTNQVKRVADEPVSTFAVDVDTASFANVRRLLCSGTMPPADAVRVEELVNYFRYDLPAPARPDRPFSVTTDMAITPWNPDTRLLRVALRGYDVARTQRPRANLVFLVDVSGSMNTYDKLPLVKRTLRLAAERLNPGDTVAVVVYAGTVGLVLPPTSDSEAITAAVDRLSASGSTAGGQGLQLAYATARANFVRDGINRIILATDGDFNVGLSDTRALMDLVRREKAGGITLTTLGFGTGNYNDEMMEAIASAGNGNYAYIDSEAEARKVLDEELSSTLFTIARDVKVQVEFNPGVVAEYRLIGYENRLLSEADFRNDAVEGGDIGAGHRVTALYEIALVGSKGQRLGERRYEANRKVPVPGKPGELAYVRLRYKQGEAAASREFGKAVPASLAAGAARPTGELAFAAAVAGLGQALRGGTYLNGFGYKDAQRLAEASGTIGDVHRRQFIGLAALADAQAPKPAR